MATKQPTSISLSDEQRRAITDAQEKLTRDGIRPSRNDVMRAAMALGLPLLVRRIASSDAVALPSPPKSAA